MADAARIVQALKATLEAGQQKEAEAYLDEARSTPGFVPGLLSLVMSAELDGPTRQAGAIYLKNTVNRFWRPSGDESDCDNNSTPVFSLSEPDRVHLRATIIEAMLQAPEAILSQLRVCLSAMLQDFPARWGADLPDQLCRAVATENLSLLPGALTAAYTFAKSFQYAKSDQRGPVDETMSRLLPLLLQRLAQADADGPTAFSALVQKLVLKIFYAYTSNYLPPILETNHQLVLLWSEAITRIVRAPVPDECQQGVDPEDRPELCWWKAKKWSMHCLQAWFEKFGPNDDLSKRDASFGDWYVKAVPGTVLQVVFEWLDRYSRGEYLSPKMLYHMLSYLETAVPYAHTWRYIKPHMQEVIARVCFPIMCHSESDAELWESDPVEYVKSKFDVFEEFSSPAVSAQNLIHTASQKRREVLDKCMQFCVEIINRDTTTARELDGALHIVGVVADLLAKKRLYKREIERFLRDKVFPQTRSPHGFLRARSCWLFQRFSEAKLSPEALRQIAELIRMSLVEDKELPVRMEAAIALQDVINDQDEFAEIAKPYVPALLQALLETMRQTGNDELNSVLQKVFLEYREDIGPLAQSIVQQLSDTFIQLLKSTGHNGPDGSGGGNESGAAGTDEDDEDSAVLAMGILTTLETIASVLEEDSQLMSQLEPIMIGLVRYILSDGIVEYYEEAISLAHSLICERVSDAMWTVLPLLYQCFERDGPDYFNDMMNPLYCYVTVDPDAFLADPSRIDIVLRMCCSVLECGKADEETEYNAAKLLEVMLLHFPGRIDALVPRILQAAVGRVLGDRAPETSELRAMCLLVGVAALLHWPEATLQLLCQQPGLFDRFLGELIVFNSRCVLVRSGGIGDPHPAGVPDEGAEVSDIVRGGQLVHPLGVAEVFVPRLVEVRAEGDVMLRGLLSYATEGTETFLFRLGMAERLCLYSVQLFQWSCAAVEQRAVGEAVNALAAPVHTDIQRNVVSARDGGLEAPPDVEGGRAIRAHGLTSAPIAGWTTPEQQVEDDLPRSDVGGKIVLLEGVFPLRGETHVGVFTEEPGADLLDASRAGVEGSVAPAGRRWSGTLNDQRREGGRAGVPGDGHQVSQRELELGFVLEGEDDAAVGVSNRLDFDVEGVVFPEEVINHADRCFHLGGGQRTASRAHADFKFRLRRHFGVRASIGLLWPLGVQRGVGTLVWLLPFPLRASRGFIIAPATVDDLEAVILRRPCSGAQWISDVDCFLSLHDRKLCVLGFCTLLTCPPDRMPACFAAALPSLLPQFLALFHGLKAAYQLKSRLENEAEDDDDGDGDAEASGEDDNSAVSGDGLNASNGGGKQRGGRRSNGKADADDENKELDSDEDDIDPEQEEYVARLKQLDKAAGGGDNGDDEGDEDDDDEEYEDEDLVNPMYETKLDEDDCELDEYAVFKSTLESLAASQSQVYTQLFGAANEQQRSQLQEVLHMAELRVNARQSKKIGQSGGYTFSQTAVPIAFDFGVGGGGGSAQTFQGFSSGAPRQ
uniref:Importin N-terminal domain-containing protein n=1 Tax=Macrostomum lignano TaxID=282301 RepID=A0A1I8G6B0_9PLAT